MFKKLYNQKYFLFLFLFSFCFGQEDFLEEPKAVFQVLYWEEGLSEKLLYAPWGNPLEENATLLELSVHSSRLSSKFSYYGDSPLRLYKKVKNTSADNLNDDGNSVTATEEKLELAFEYSFSPTSNLVEEILFLIGSKPKSFVKSFPFSSSRTSLGTFNFHSFAKETIYLMAGKQKLTLSPKESKNVNLLEEDSKSLRISIYTKEKTEFKKIYGRKIMNHKQKRGIFLIRTQLDTLKVMPVIDSGSSRLSDAIGYGTKANIEPPIIRDSNSTSINN